MSVARTRLCDFLARRGRQAQGSGDTAVEKVIEAQPSEDGEEDRWEQDYQRCVFDWAVEQIRGDFQDSTWQAFWQTNVEGKETKKVAQSLGMTVGAVYIARSRVLARLKKEIGQVED
jgi:RNA polymerase sigma-70 factor (ECF subfamily)